MRIEVTRRQLDFIQAGADEVLFGGAAGGGKSYGQIIDALVTALRYNGSRQLILRRTMPELERTLIRSALAQYPKDRCSHLVTMRTMAFCNGSTIEFGYCNHEKDVYRYQSAEYDVIRFDELTHFTRHMYTYLMSRLRGTGDCPKQMKSSTNPGNVGHSWVKDRFVDIGPADTVHETDTGSRIFLPAKLDDNGFLMRRDPDYKKRLLNLDDEERKALLEGSWDITDGCYFNEWRRDIHVMNDFELPDHWPVYFTMDYGLDMLAGYWIAVDPNGRAYVFRELYEGGHIISQAARRITEMTREPVREYLAPPDLWNRRQESGRSAAELFLDHGIALTKTPAARVAGWLELKEWLKPFVDETGQPTARMVFFENCANAIRTIPAIRHDETNPSDCAGTPHELTHAPDALRYFVASRVAERPDDGQADNEDQDQLTDLLQYRGR